MSPAEQAAARAELVADLRALMDASLRVKAFTQNPAGGFSVEFFPAATVAALDTTKPDKTIDPGTGLSICACGHLTAEHGYDGTCLKQCPAEKCAPDPS